MNNSVSLKGGCCRLSGLSLYPPHKGLVEGEFNKFVYQMSLYGAMRSVMFFAEDVGYTLTPNAALCKFSVNRHQRPRFYMSDFVHFFTRKERAGDGGNDGAIGQAT